MKFSPLKQRVKNYLLRMPESRDSDQILITMILMRESEDILKKRMERISAREFLILMAKGQLSNTETIRRNRQLLQQRHPELRGKNYNYRHTVGEPESINDIKQNY